MRSEQVPISVQGSDIPGDIELGEAINIYWVPEAMGMQEVGRTSTSYIGGVLTFNRSQKCKLWNRCGVNNICI